MESGIPPFPGSGGLWTKLGEPTRTAYQTFLKSPKLGGKTNFQMNISLRSTIFQPALINATPNDGHYDLVALEEIGLLQYIITQNMDGLHLDAGS